MNGRASRSRSGSCGAGNGGLSLPTVSIDGATGHELDTALGTMLTFTRGAGARYRLETTDQQRAQAVCRAQAGIEEVQLQGDAITFAAEDAAVALLSQALVEAGALIRALAPQTLRLEDLFLSLTEEGNGAGAPAGSAPVLEARA